MKRAKLSGPTPPKVLKAIQTIAEYLRAGNWEQAIISKNGGASLRLTDIYEDLIGEPAKRIKEAAAAIDAGAEGEE